MLESRITDQHKAKQSTNNIKDQAHDGNSEANGKDPFARFLQELNFKPEPSVKAGNGNDIVHDSPNKEVVKAYRDINAKPEDVWKVLGKFDALPWHPAIESGTVETKGGETLRTLVTKDGHEKIVEELESQGTNFLTYKVLSDSAPNSQTVLQVEPDGKGGSEVTWAASVEGGTPKAADALGHVILDFCATGLDVIKSRFDNEGESVKQSENKAATLSAASIDAWQPPASKTTQHEFDPREIDRRANSLENLAYGALGNGAFKDAALYTDVNLLDELNKLRHEPQSYIDAVNNQIKSEKSLTLLDGKVVPALNELEIAFAKKGGGNELQLSANTGIVDGRERFLNAQSDKDSLTVQHSGFVATRDSKFVNDKNGKKSELAEATTIWSVADGLRKW